MSDLVSNIVDRLPLAHPYKTREAAARFGVGPEEVPEPWVPTELASLEAWWDVGDAGTLSGNLPSEITNIADKSGNSLDLQDSNGFPPVLESDAFGVGLDGANMDAPNIHMSTASNPFGSNVPEALFAAIVKVNQQGSGRTLVSLTEGFSNPQFWKLHLPWNNDNNLRWLVGDGASGVNAPLPNTLAGRLAIGEVAIAVFYASNTQGLLVGRVNGTEFVNVTGFSPNATVLGNICIGNASDGVSNSEDGRHTIGEILIGSDAGYALDDFEKIEGYLAHKWGFTNLLPYAHPYRLDGTEFGFTVLPDYKTIVDGWDLGGGNTDGVFWDGNGVLQNVAGMPCVNPGTEFTLEFKVARDTGDGATSGDETIIFIPQPTGDRQITFEWQNNNDSIKGTVGTGGPNNEEGINSSSLGPRNRGEVYTVVLTGRITGGNCEWNLYIDGVFAEQELDPTLSSDFGFLDGGNPASEVGWVVGDNGFALLGQSTRVVVGDIKTYDEFTPDGSTVGLNQTSDLDTLAAYNETTTGTVTPVSNFF